MLYFQGPPPVVGEKLGKGIHYYHCSSSCAYYQQRTEVSRQVDCEETDDVDGGVDK